MSESISLRRLVGRYRWRVGLTFLLVIAEAAALLLFPLFVGIAIDGLLEDRFGGLVALGALGAVALAIGAARRLIDTRTYARVYEEVATEHVEREHRRGTSVSTISARTTLLNEFVEFLENSLPEIVNSAIAILGTLVILWQVDGRVALAALGLALLVVSVYGVTGAWNTRLTGSYHDEFERQVDAIESRRVDEARSHFSRLMTWNRRLSDLETLHYSIIYVGVIALLVYSPVALIQADEPRYGSVFAAIMYVLQYVEAVLMLPVFAQQLVRLREITTRLAGTSDDQVTPAGTPAVR